MNESRRTSDSASASFASKRKRARKDLYDIFGSGARSRSFHNNRLGNDPLGLTVLYRPKGDRCADVVFVHGLGGSSMKTWSKDGDPEYCWPKKFLPNEHDINTARISTFGYDTNVKPGSPKHLLSILDCAKDLLYDLKFAQDEEVPENDGLGMGEVIIPIKDRKI
jgi:hypothetical protein